METLRWILLGVIVLTNTNTILEALGAPGNQRGVIAAVVATIVLTNRDSGTPTAR